MRAAVLAASLLVALGCGTQSPPAPAAPEPAPPADPPPPADDRPPAETAAASHGKVVESRTETGTTSQHFSVTLPADLESDIPCTATGVDQFMAALFVRVRNRLKPPPGYQMVMPGRPSAAAVKVAIEVPPSGEPLGVTLKASSGVQALDRAVVAAVESSRCMPPPPPRLVDSKTRTFQIVETYGFERPN